MLKFKMAEKKSGRKRKKGDEDHMNPSKDETAVAKYLRFNLPTKKATMFGEKAAYFSGSSAIDFLLDSKWAKSSKSSVAFTHRESVLLFLQRLLDCGLISRVHVTKTEKKVKDKKKDEKSIGVSKPVKGEGSEKAPGSPRSKKDKENKETKKVKKKVKVSLEIQDFQDFFDADDEYYVWIFDPISWKTFILGILLVLGVIVVCLFPLWPESIREYSWYLSVTGAIFVGAILILAILRYIIYGLLWLATMGKLHFWLLPNLTAECGFFESFVPTYEYTVYKKEEQNDSDGDERRGSKDNDVGELEKPNEKPGTEGSQQNSDDSSKEGSEWVKVKKADAEQEPSKATTC